MVTRLQDRLAQMGLPRAAVCGVISACCRYYSADFRRNSAGNDGWHIHTGTTEGQALPYHAPLYVVRPFRMLELYIGVIESSE